MGERLFKLEDQFLAHELVTNVQAHDQSKFRGIEWMYLHDDIKDKEPEKFNMAWEQHVKTNPHHPEYWAGIKFMPDVYIAEFVCDTFSRSSEFGTDYNLWLDEVATKKYDFTKRTTVWKKIKKYKNILINKASFDSIPFKNSV